MAPRSRLLDLERHDVLFFYGDGAYHQSSVATYDYGIVFWPVVLVAALLLHLIAPFPHAAAVCGALYVAYCFLLDRAAKASSSSSWPSTATATAAPPSAEASRPATRGTVAGYTIVQKQN